MKFDRRKELRVKVIPPSKDYVLRAIADLMHEHGLQYMEAYYGEEVKVAPKPVAERVEVQPAETKVPKKRRGRPPRGRSLLDG